MKVTTILLFLASFAIAAPRVPHANPDVDLNNEGPHELFARKDGYPYAGRCSGNDKWLFSRCQCTSYVAWRLNKAGHKFNNNYKDVHWGWAYNWDDAARQAKVKVNKKPVVGAVAQTDVRAGRGHVAYVTRVSKNEKEIDVEEYNYENPLKYGKRTKLDASQFKYIHF
ncbi:hypothetical protein Q7P37_010408 [Cladosporium fusiforme]